MSGWQIFRDGTGAISSRSPLRLASLPPLLALLRLRSLLKPKLMLRRNRHLNPALTSIPRTHSR